MKSILLSIQPKWVCEILNGRKTVEIRRKFPKDYVGWVYIYCTKDRKTKLSSNSFQYYVIDNKYYKNYMGSGNGEVLARFWCEKITEIKNRYGYFQTDDNKYSIHKVLENSCLSAKDLGDYLCANGKIGRGGYAIHISKLEIFDTPKDISEFKQPRDSYGKVNWNTNEYYYMELTKAPQNYCFVEEME